MTAALGFLSGGQVPYNIVMQGSLFRRLVTVLAVVTLLLVGFAAASITADTPCAMPMASSMPCDGDQQDNPANDHERVPPALACFAKCPAPVLDQAIVPVAVMTCVLQTAWTALHATPTGIGVVPLLHPPRA